MDKNTLSNYGWVVICVMVLAVIGVAFAILITCLLIDRARIYLFQFVRLPVLCQKIEEWINRCWNKWNKD